MLKYSKLTVCIAAWWKIETAANDNQKIPDECQMMT